MMRLRFESKMHKKSAYVREFLALTEALDIISQLNETFISFLSNIYKAKFVLSVNL
jgi:hypothetical protein